MSTTEAVRRLNGNEPIPLKSLKKPLIIETGAVAVFAVRNLSAAARRFLFQVDPGALLAPMPATSEWELIAVPLTDSNSREAASADDEWNEWNNKLARSAGVDVWPSNRDSEIAAAFFAALSASEDLEAKRDRERFEFRRHSDSQVVLDSLAALAGVPPAAGAAALTASPETPFLRAVRAVAGAQGIAVEPPLASERAEDPVHAVAESSRFRTRKVLLRDRWWRRENGPLLARLSDGDHPIALLPAASRTDSRYVLFDPRDESRTVVDARLASTINPSAYMFYRPFPDDTSTASLLLFALKPYRKDIRRIAVLGLAVIALGMVAPQANVILFNQAIPNADRTLIWEIAIAMGAATAASTLFVFAQNVQRVQGAAFVTLQTGIWDRLLRLQAAFFRRFTAGELRLRADRITMIQYLVSGDAIRLIFMGALSFFIVPLLFYYNAALGVVALCAGFLVLLAAFLGSRSLWRLQARSLEVEGALSGLVLQIIGAVPKLRVAGAEGRAFAQWARAYSARQTLALRIQSVKNAVRIVNLTSPALVTACSFLYLLSPGGRTLSLGAFLAYYAALTLFLTTLTQASETFIGLIMVGNLWQQTEPILRERPEVDRARTHPGRLMGRIAMDNVTFRYRSDGPLTLDGVRFKAEPGQSIALTGPSGGGKSTIVNVLLGFEVPQSGAVYFDGQDLSSLDISAVRRQIGVVTQNGKIMARSVFDNICGSGTFSMEEAWDAARAAGLAEDIELMPMGMHTRISEAGSNISGGQRQRLLIARALVLKPRIVIFDEATSALDNRTQAVVTESLGRLNATRIIIAHRLSTVRHADCIYVLQNGRVVQQGTYDELTGQPGLFAKLAGRQAI